MGNRQGHKNNNKRDKTMKTELDKYDACKDAVEFRKEHSTFQEAWENCPRGDWMLWIAQRVGVNKRKLTLAKALCVETVKHLMKDERSLNALKVAKRYGRYKANDSELRDAAAAAAAYAAAAYDAADAAAYAAAAYDAYAAAAANAANAAYDAAAKKQNQQETADICRKILTKDVLRLIKK